VVDPPGENAERRCGVELGDDVDLQLRAVCA